MDNLMVSKLEAILNWKMSPEEARIYKMCLVWERTISNELPGYLCARLPKKTDPRKCLLYRYCHKLARETKGLIPEDQYKLYIVAQVQMLKLMTDGTVHASIEPVCLCGESAWIRWQMWQKKYEKQLLKLDPIGNVDDIKSSSTNIEIDLLKTKKFFIQQFGDVGLKNKVETAIRSKEIVKWVSFNKISHFYLVLSPLVKQYFKNIDDSFSIDSEIIEKSISPKMKEVFADLFRYEF